MVKTVTEKYSEITSGYELQQNVSLTNSLGKKTSKTDSASYSRKNWASDYYLAITMHSSLKLSPEIK